MEQPMKTDVTSNGWFELYELASVLLIILIPNLAEYDEERIIFDGNKQHAYVMSI